MRQFFRSAPGMSFLYSVEDPLHLLDERVDDRPKNIAPGYAIMMKLL